MVVAADRTPVRAPVSAQALSTEPQVNSVASENLDFTSVLRRQLRGIFRSRLIHPAPATLRALSSGDLV